MNNQTILVRNILDLCTEKNLMISSAESCTGGLISSALTDIAGSSKVFDKGLVTYSNDSKIKLLGISEKTLSKFGAVSKEIISEMAIKLVSLDNQKNIVSIATSGVAGPSESENKPVGLVWIASYRYDNLIIKKINLGKLNRREIRNRTVLEALALLKENLKF